MSYSKYNRRRSFLDKIQDEEPETADLINKFLAKKKLIVFGFLALFGLITLFSGVFSIDADQVGVVKFLGQYNRTESPGLGFKIPYFETLDKVRVRQVLKEEFGFRTDKAGVKTTYKQGNFSGESLMLTGDLNCAMVEWIVQYRIVDPVKYLFAVRSPEETLRDASESVMRQIVGNRSVDEVIILNRQEIEDLAKISTQEVLDEFETGLQLVTIKLQDVNPPDSVQPAFNEVNQARQEKEKIINEALRSFNQVIPEAKGKAEQTVRQAEGYATDRVNRAKGDAEKFVSVWTEYKKAKDVTRRRMYLETMAGIFKEMENVFYVDEDLDEMLPLLNFSGKATK